MTLKLPLSPQHPIAYFSLEFGLDDQLPIYAGGLGVLAGDILKEASDRQLPLVGVGLYYNHGYFRQTINQAGDQVEEYRHLPAETILEQAIGKDGRPIVVTIPLLQRSVQAKVWQYPVGSVTLYLLDTDLPENQPKDRQITKYLYGGDDDTRIGQEMVLGIGGERALSALGLQPSIYHLNEGHSAFSVFAITRRLMKEAGVSFQEAFRLACCRVVFTNHTLVTAGNDIFSQAKLRPYLTQYARQMKTPVDKLLAKGALPGNPSYFGMTPLALGISCRINAVSKLHARLAKKVWPDVKMLGITNGVHLPTWVGNDFQNLSPDFSDSALDSMSDQLIWEAHSQAKKRLINYLNSSWAGKFDEAILTMVWARRFATYKQPDLLFSELNLFKKLSKSAHGAIQVIIAGKAHPRDQEGKKLIKHINTLIRQEDLSSWIIFLPDYSISKAKYLTQGADVWLNTPIRGQEASGTSGMKAGANGVLQCSTRDGWVDEIPLTEIGWELDGEDTADHLYQIIEHEMLPLYYSNNSQYPTRWVQKMRQTMKIVWRNYSSRRMLNDYLKFLYPAAVSATIRK